MLYKSEAEEAQKSLIERRVEQQETMPVPNIPVAPLENQGQ
jgi:hypothetical protein